MSKSPPYELCCIARLVHDKERGQGYRITGRDLKEAKEFLIAGGGEMPDADTVTAYMKEYLGSNFQGWRDLNWPLWGLFRNWNTYAPKPERKKKLNKCEIHKLEFEGMFCPQCYVKQESNSGR